MSEVYEMYKAGAIAISDDGIPLQNSKILRYALEYCKMLDIPIINHAEDLCLKDDGVMHEGVVSTQLGLKSSPGITESNMIHRDLELADLTQSRLHVPHVSSSRSVEHINVMKNKINNITVEVRPHH